MLILPVVAMPIIVPVTSVLAMVGAIILMVLIVSYLLADLL